MILVWPAEVNGCAGNDLTWTRVYFLFGKALDLGIPIGWVNHRYTRHAFYTDVIPINGRQVSILILILCAEIKPTPINDDMDRIRFRGGERFPICTLQIRIRRAPACHTHVAHTPKGACRGKGNLRLNRLPIKASDATTSSSDLY